MEQIQLAYQIQFVFSNHRFKNIIPLFYNCSDRLLGERWKVANDTEWNVFDIQSFFDLYQIS